MIHEFFENRHEYRFSDFSGFIDEARRRYRKSSSAKNMYLGNMWDRGRGYIGPVPVDGDEDSGTILRNIQRMFTSRNVIEEVVDRQVDALLSKSPDWKIFNKKTVLKDPTSVRVRKAPPLGDPGSLSAKSTNTTDNDTVTDEKILEAEAILSNVWTEAKIGDALKQAFAERLVTGKGVLRIHLSKKFEDVQDTIAGDLLETSKYIKVDFVENELGSIIDDDGNKLSVIEIGKVKKEQTIEVSFVTKDQKTFVVTLQKGSTGISAQQAGSTDDPETEIDEVLNKLNGIGADVSSPISLKGNITASDIIGKPFVSESMLQNNRALNLDLSLGVGILVEAGYAEMVVTNVALETTEVDDPSNPGSKITKPIGLKRGAGVINNLIGEQTIDAEGKVYYEKPSVHFKEPSPLVPFTQGEMLYYMQILQEAKQVHVLLNHEADPSGESRIQSRQDFVKKSQRYKPSVDTLGTWVLNAVISLCASAANKDGYFEDIDCIFDSKVYAGELSAAEQDVVISRYEHSLISRQSAMVLLGIEDPIVELQLIAQDDEDKLAKQVKQLEATAKFGNMVSNGQPPKSEVSKQQEENSTKNIQTRTAKKGA